MKLSKLALALLMSLIALPVMADRNDDKDRQDVNERHAAHKDRDHDEGRHLGQKKHKHKKRKHKDDDDFVEPPRLPAPLPDVPKPRLPELPKPHLPDLPKPKLPDLPKLPLPPLPGRN